MRRSAPPRPCARAPRIPATRTLETSMRRTFLSLAVLAAASLVSTAALAQAWPAKPIRAVVPFAPGSATDQIGRAFAAEMAKALGQTIIVDNKPGVNGMLG